MQKFIPKEKLGKKAKKTIDKKARGTWGAVNPVTKDAENKKTYNRKKVQKGDDFFPVEPFSFIWYNV
jgi:hypothetical protein